MNESRSASWLNASQARRGMVRAAFCAMMPLLACGGCGKSAAINGKLVKGTVTYNGSPVEGATVSFISATSAGYGQTDAQGHFTLRSSQGEGLPVGSYQVTVSKIETPPAEKIASDQEAGYAPPDPDAPPPPTPPDKDLLPAKYKAAESSGLSANVSESGPNEFSFPLTD